MVWLCRLIRVEGDDEVVVIFHIVKRIREKVGKPKRPVWASTVDSRHTWKKNFLQLKPALTIRSEMTRDLSNEYYKSLIQTA